MHKATKREAISAAFFVFRYLILLLSSLLFLFFTVVDREFVVWAFFFSSALCVFFLTLRCIDKVSNLFEFLFSQGIPEQVMGRAALTLIYFMLHSLREDLGRQDLSFLFFSFFSIDSSPFQPTLFFILHCARHTSQVYWLMKRRADRVDERTENGR